VKVDADVGAVSNLWLGTIDTNYNWSGQGRLYLDNGGALVVAGEMIVGKEGRGFVQQNGGALTVNGALTLAQQTNSAGQYTLSNGMLYATQILPGAGNGSFSFQGGQLGFAQFGSAAQTLNLFAAGGTLTITNTTGTSYLFGNYNNDGGATLSIQLGNTTNALAVSGVATLAGTLQIGFAPGFEPASGEEFSLLTASSVSGVFTNVILPVVDPDGVGLLTSGTATSVVAMAVNFTPRFSAPLLTNGFFQYTLTGVAGSSYVLQTCTNLGGGNWISLATNTSPFTFQELIAAPQRFYRAIYLP
jgi:hypothetical protein